MLPGKAAHAPAQPAPGKARILWVRVGGCLPLTSGGRIRSYYTLTHLLHTHHLHVVELHRQGDSPEDPGHAYAHYLDRMFFPGLPAWSSRRLPAFAWPLLRNFFTSNEPFALERYHCDDLAGRVQALDAAGDHDLIVCDGLAAATAFEGWDKPRQTPAVMFQHNVEALIWERLAAVQRTSLKRLYFLTHAKRMHAREPDLCRLFDGVITISEEDASYHRDAYGLTNVLGTVPAGAQVDVRGIPEAVLRHSATPCIAILGSMDWLPNQDAVTWFVQDILPRIRQSVPGVRLRVIGRTPPPALLKLAEDVPGVELTGTIPDVTEPLRECALMVVPLRAGSGTRIKILESMAAGVPVVSTTVGAEGLPLHSNHDLLLADDVPGLTNAVLRVLADDGLRRALAENGLRRVMEDFSWKQSAEKFVTLTAPLIRAKR